MSFSDQKSLAEHVEKGDLELVKGLEFFHLLKYSADFKISVDGLV